MDLREYPVIDLLRLHDNNDNIEAIYDQIIDMFGVALGGIKRKGNMWYLKSRAQAIPRYLMKILDLQNKTSLFNT